MDELPFLLSKSRELDQLKVVISDLEVFRCLVKSEDGKFDLIKYWQQLGEFRQAETAYTAALQQLPDSCRHDDSYLQLLFELAAFFADLGLYQAARYGAVSVADMQHTAVSHGEWLRCM